MLNTNGKTLVQGPDIFDGFNIVGAIKRAKEIKVELNLFVPFYIFVDHTCLILVEYIPEPEPAVTAKVYHATTNTANRHSDKVQFFFGFQISRRRSSFV